MQLRIKAYMKDIQAYTIYLLDPLISYRSVHISAIPKSYLEKNRILDLDRIR